jgi:RNA recognition motif-containing protein
MSPTRGFGSSDWRAKETTAGSRPLGDNLEKERRVRKEQRILDEPGRDKSEGARIYVGNLSYTVQKNDVERLFDEAGYDV